MTTKTEKFPLPMWALALMLLGGTGAVSAVSGVAGSRMAETPGHEPSPHLHETLSEDVTALDREVSDVESLTAEHERRFQSLEFRFDRYEDKQDLIYTNQLLLCIKFDLECERYAPH